MTPRQKEQLFNQRLDTLEGRLPAFAGRALSWLRQPQARWVRQPVAVLLMVGGLLGFLPVLGFWMLPLGILLLAHDIQVLKGPVVRGLSWLERTWLRLRTFRLRSG